MPSAFGVGNGNTSTQLRFDVSTLAGAMVNSLTLRLTQNLSLPREGGTLEVYRLLPANADWNNNGTYGTKDGVNPWAGGPNGALVAGTDYDPVLLGSVAYNPAGAVGTVYDVVVPGESAAALIEAWTTGVNASALKGAIPEGWPARTAARFYQADPTGRSPSWIILRYSRRSTRRAPVASLPWWDCPGYVLESTGQLPARPGRPFPEWSTTVSRWTPRRDPGLPAESTSTKKRHDATTIVSI